MSFFPYCRQTQNDLCEETNRFGSQVQQECSWGKPPHQDLDKGAHSSMIILQGVPKQTGLNHIPSWIVGRDIDQSVQGMQIKN